MPKQFDDLIQTMTLLELEEVTLDVAQKLTAYAEELVGTGDYHPSLIASGFLWAAVYMAISPKDADDPLLLSDEELLEQMETALREGFKKFRGVTINYH